MVFCQARRLAVGDSHAVDRQMPRLWFEQAEDHVDQRRFAGASLADDSHRRPGRNAEANPVQRPRRRARIPVADGANL